MIDNYIEIEWYGRCCFFVKIGNRKVVFDPYDKYCNVDIGVIDAEVLLSSSTWHYHGHIGASPGAWIYSYAGVEKNSNLEITGIEAKEDRGSPTVVFNLRYKGFSITNFADLGEDRIEGFDANLTSEQLKVIESTNMIFMRASNTKVLQYCKSGIIFPEHYFPRSFIQEQVPNNEKDNFLKPNLEIDKMLEKLNIPLKEVDNYKYEVDKNDLAERKIVKLLKLHPQVRYVDDEEVKRYW